MAKDCLAPFVIMVGGGTSRNLFFFFFFLSVWTKESGIPFRWQETAAALGVSLETQGTVGAVTRERVLLPAPLKIRCKTSRGGGLSLISFCRDTAIKPALVQLAFIRQTVLGPTVEIKKKKKGNYYSRRTSNPVEVKQIITVSSWKREQADVTRLWCSRKKKLE